MEYEKLSQEVVDLLKIPDVGLSLLHKIEELKLILSRNIHHYRKSGEISKPQKVFQTMKGTEFELHRLGEYLWIPEVPSLKSRINTNAYDIIPEPIIDYIVNIRTDKGLVEMRPGVELPELKDRLFDLSFEKINPHLIWGIISERPLESSGFIYPDPRLNKSTTRDLRENSGEDELIKLLVYYLSNCNDYYDHVVNEFLYRWKPLIDSQLIADTAKPGAGS